MAERLPNFNLRRDLPEQERRARPIINPLCHDQRL